MKKKLLLYVIMNISITYIFGYDNIYVHEKIIMQAYELLKLRYTQSGNDVNDLNEIRDAIYYSAQPILHGSKQEDYDYYCSLWILGGLDPFLGCSTYDPIYGYQMQSLAHFWNADMGDDYHQYLCGLGPYHNAWEKATKYIEDKLTVSNYNSDKNQSYEFLGRLLHLLADMGVPAHAHDDEHGGCSSSDAYEDYYAGTHADNALTNYSHFDDLSGDGGFIYNTPCLSTSDLSRFLFYTMNQISDYFLSNDADGDTYLWNGTNEVIEKNYAEFNKYNYASTYGSRTSSSYIIYTEEIAKRITPFLVSSTATLLYWYGIFTGQLQSITSFNLSSDYSNYDQNVIMHDKISLKPGFIFSSNTASNTFNAKIEPCSSNTLKSCRISEGPITEDNAIKNQYQTKTNISDLSSTLSDNSQEIPISIYPNPTNDLLFVEGLSDFDAIVLDLSGRTAFSVSKANGSIDLSCLNPGIYMLHLKSSGKTYIQKVVKQ